MSAPIGLQEEIGLARLEVRELLTQAVEAWNARRYDDAIRLRQQADATRAIVRVLEQRLNNDGRTQ